jgi:hypothetical protein
VSEIHHRNNNRLLDFNGLLRNFPFEPPEFSMLISNVFSKAHTIWIIHGLQGRISETETVPQALVLNELISNSIKYGDNTIGVNISLRQESLTGKVLIATSNYCQLLVDFVDSIFNY